MLIMSYIQTVIINFIVHALIHCQSQTNEWTKEIGANGEDIWRSLSNFIPVQSQSFGSIKLGQIMSVEFDFVWNGRSNDPRTGYFENFFRVGYDATISDNCYGEGSRYPSFWLTNNQDTLHVSVSSGTTCQPSHSLHTYGVITIGISYHINIAFDNTQLSVYISGGDRPNWNKTWLRVPTQKQFLGDEVPVWWMSNVNSGTPFNRGNATFSNIVMISNLFEENATAFPTVSPTYNPIITPTTTPTIIPTYTPTNNPTIIPTDNPSMLPTNVPTDIPTNVPTDIPTNVPTPIPTALPTNKPTVLPTNTPTLLPTDNPSNVPSTRPSASPIESTDLPTPRPVYGSLIECKHNEDCNIICNHPYDCHLSNILCPKTRNACNVYCTSYACQHITINAYFIHGGSINIKCNGTKSCLGATIDSQHSVNTTLTVEISSTNALSNAYIYCADLQCNIMSLHGYNSFEGLMNSKIIAQEKTQSLLLDVNGDGILKNCTIQCPQKRSSVSNVCQIMVGNDDEMYTEMLANTIIQSQGGLNQIDIISGNDKLDVVQIECGTNYEFSCAAERTSIINTNYTETYWKCANNINSDFVCDNTDYIDLICVITGGDIVLIDKPVGRIEELIIALDGNTYTYDPKWMHVDVLIKSHLAFQWRCEYQIGTSRVTSWMDCNHMFNGLDQESVVYAYFDTLRIIEYEYYVFKYTLVVTDTTNSLRLCSSIPSITVSISTIPNEDVDVYIPMLSVSIQSLHHSHEIYVDTPIRLIGTLSTLDGTDIDSYFYTYEWSEISGQISNDELSMISNSINEKNLIISRYSLMENNEYEIVLSVTQYKDNMYVQTVQSQSVVITVSAPDISVVNSTVIIDDNCIFSPVKYETFEELFHGFFNITFDGQYAAQNGYQFGYSIANYMNSDKILLHSSWITSSTYFNHFVLPASSSIIFHVDIMDSQYKSVEINTSEFCMIEIEEEVMNECISYKQDVYNAYKQEEKQLFTIQTSHSVLYLLRLEEMTIECKQSYMEDVLDTLSEEFSDLCESDFVLQLAQVLTGFVGHSDLYLLDTVYLQQMYDLSVSVLDPCLTFIDINSNELEACSGSVITLQSAVCYKGESITLSKLFTVNRYSYIFMSFIASLIDVADVLDLFSLIRKSLYIYQLLGLSVSIPYELSLYDSNTFQLCSYRTLNENIQCNGSDISVFLTANDTAIGNKDLNDISPDLNGVDISVIFLRTNKSKALVVDPCSLEKRKNELQGKSASIMLSSDSNTTNLTSNVSITFTMDIAYDLNEIKCVWYNQEEGVWDTSGCSTSIDTNRIVCVCSHLTTFSTIQFLYDDCLDSFGYTKVNINFNLIFLILFFLLFSKITSDFILIFDGAFIKRLKKHRKDGAFSGPGSVYICTLFELLLCIEFHIAFTFKWNWHKPVLILTLLLPLLSFCWMFFCILRTWIRITHSFGSDTIIVQRIEKGIHYFMFFFISFILAETVLIFVANNYYIYGEIIWCAIMSIFTVSYVIYATTAIKTIWKSIMAVKHDIIENPNDDTKLVRKLLTVSILLALYFIMKTFISIYLALNDEYGFIWRIIDMFMEFTSLCIIYCLYGGGIKRLLDKYNNIPIWTKCYTKCIKPKIYTVKIKENTTNVNRKQSHAFVVSHSRKATLQPGISNCPSNSTDTVMTINYNQTPTHTASNPHTTRRHKSTTGSTTPSISALPYLSQLELPDTASLPSRKKSNDDVYTQRMAHIQNAHHHIVHSSSSFESSLYSQFSNAARTRFPSLHNMELDAPLPEQSDQFEDASTTHCKPPITEPSPPIIHLTKQYHE